MVIITSIFLARKADAICIMGRGDASSIFIDKAEEAGGFPGNRREGMGLSDAERG